MHSSGEICSYRNLLHESNRFEQKFSTRNRASLRSRVQKSLDRKLTLALSYYPRIVINIDILLAPLNRERQLLINSINCEHSCKREYFHHDNNSSR